MRSIELSAIATLSLAILAGAALEGGRGRLQQERQRAPKVLKKPHGTTPYGPTDMFWRHNLETKTLTTKNGDNIFHVLQNCLDRELGKDKALLSTSKPLDSTREVVRMIEDGDWVALVQISNAITPVHVRAVEALSACAQKHVPNCYEARSTEPNGPNYEFDPAKMLGGGNNPTHFGPLLSIFLPDTYNLLLDTLQFAYDKARWSELEGVEDYLTGSPERLLNSSEVGCRASEHVSYKDFKEGIRFHDDGQENFYTVNCALVDDYEGGEFVIKADNRLHTMKPNRYDCLVFLGGMYQHSVNEITSGHRAVFSNEFWELPDIPFGATLHDADWWKMLKYMRLCGMKAPCDVDIETLEWEDGDDEENNNFRNTYMGEEDGWNDYPAEEL